MSSEVQIAFDALPAFVSVGETAKFLGISTRKVRELCEQGWLDCFSLSHGRGKTYRINKDSIGSMACVGTRYGIPSDGADKEKGR